MYVRLKKSARTVNPIVQIVESERHDGKVKQKVIASLGSASTPEAFERLERMAQSLLQKLKIERERQPHLFQDLENNSPAQDGDGNHEAFVKLSNLVHEDTVFDGCSIVVSKLMELCGFDEIAKRAKGREKFDGLHILNLVAAQRFFAPASKLRTYERQGVLGFSNVKLHHIYRAMDALSEHNEAFQRAAFINSSAGLFKETVDCVFFDVTTLYFESVESDDLKEFGFSKDQKHHSVQVVLCLVVNRSGIPLAYELFKGNTAEVTTLLPVMEKFKSRFDVDNVTIVCDRGLSSLNNLTGLEKSGFHYVAACKIKHLPKSLKLSDLSTFQELYSDEQDTVMYRELDHPSYPNAKLIVTHSKKRAEKDKQDRERIVEKIMTKMQGKTRKGHPAKKLISNHGYKKYVNVIGDGQLKLNDEAVAKDESWDGFHGIAVSKSKKMSVPEALYHYKGLWRIEETFRVAKSTQRIRPIFHWTPHRIRAHVLICFIALYLERTLELLLRQKKTPLTPDRIRYALSKMHHIRFRDRSTNFHGKMEAKLSSDARSICMALGLPLRRRTYLTGA